jgi:putative ABC transport system substrate-binding protein
MDNRRKLLVAFAAGALATPLASLAQPRGKTARVGVLLGNSPGMERYHDALRERLAGHGFVQGKNLHIEARGSAGTFSDDREHVRAMVAAGAEAIFTFSAHATAAAMAATKTVSIVFAWIPDPVVSGIVQSYRRPGANVTGVSSRFGELTHKRLELVRDLLPQAKRVAMVGQTYTDEFAAIVPGLRNTAARLQLELLEFVTADRTGWDTSLDRALKAKADALVPFAWFADSPVTGSTVIEIANRNRVAAVFADAESVERGGLISLGTNLADDVRRGADMLARMLKGAKPADLPVDQAARFELVVNLKTAKNIGLAVPQIVLVRADRVIQ